MRVLVAGRLSRKAGDRDQTGFDSQEREAVRWAQAQGHEVVAVVADFKTGRAGLSARPNLRPWVTDPAMLVRYDGIVTLKLDRLTRGDSKETADLEEWARGHDKTLLTTEGLVFPCEGADGIRWDLAKRLAHDEWLRISERYTRMQRELRAQGSLVGRNPYGYRIVPEGTRKTLAPEPAEAQVIRDAADWYLAGASLDVICERLNQAGRLPRRMKDGRQSQVGGQDDQRCAAQRGGGRPAEGRPRAHDPEGATDPAAQDLGGASLPGWISAPTARGSARARPRPC